MGYIAELKAGRHLHKRIEELFGGPVPPDELMAAFRVYQQRGRELSNPDAEEVELVYTDKLGNNWYRFVDPLRMPGDRALSALVATRRGDLNYTRDDELEWIKTARDAANRGNFMEVGYLLRVKEDRLAWACEEKTLQSIAQVYYLLNDEPQALFQRKWQDEKARIWAEDEEARAFFLREAYMLTNGFSQLSLADIPNYLAERTIRMAMAEKQKQSAAPGGKETVSPSAGK